MSNFVRDNTSLPINKHDVRPMPADPTGNLGADDWKSACQALYDVRAILQTSGFYAVAGDPGTLVPGQSWYDTVGGRFKIRDASDIGILVGYRKSGSVMMDRFSMVAQATTYGFQTPLVVGSISLDPAPFTMPGTTRTIVFRAIFSSGSGIAAHVKLRNITDGDDLLDISTNVQSTQVRDVLIPVGNSAGKIRNDGSPRIYEVWIWVVNPVNPADVIRLFNAELRIVYTV